MTRSLTYSTRSLAGLKGESMRKLIVASAFAALMASAPAMAASPGGSVGGGAAARGGIFTPGIAAPGGNPGIAAAQVRQVRLAQVSPAHRSRPRVHPCPRQNPRSTAGLPA